MLFLVCLEQENGNALPGMADRRTWMGSDCFSPLCLSYICFAFAATLLVGALPLHCTPISSLTQPLGRTFFLPLNKSLRGGCCYLYMGLIYCKSYWRKDRKTFPKTAVPLEPHTLPFSETVSIFHVIFIHSHHPSHHAPDFLWRDGRRDGREGGRRRFALSPFPAACHLLYHPATCL